MTAVTFIANSAHDTVNWNTPAAWSDGVTPNDPSVDVVVPAVTYINNPEYTYFYSDITISDNYSIHSLLISENELDVSGSGVSFTIGGTLTLGAGAEVTVQGGGTLSAASIAVGNELDVSGRPTEFGGDGTINVSGAFLNQFKITGSGLTINAVSFNNTGVIEGNIQLNVVPGGFADFSGSTLTGGSYNTLDDGVLLLNVGGIITIDAATITLGADAEFGYKGEIESSASPQAPFQPIEATLQTVAAGGVLNLDNGADSWGPLTIDGLLELNGGDPSTPQLTIDASGIVMGVGSISGPIIDDGELLVGLQTFVASSTPVDLEIKGAITGSGILGFEAALPPPYGIPPLVPRPWTVQLDGPASVTVAFDDKYGELILKDPSHFSGSIRPAGAGDQVMIPGVALGSVTSYAYSGNTQSGTLTVNLSDGSQIALNFLGDFNTESFGLSAGPQVISSDPPSLIITDNGTVVLVPDSTARDNFLGNGLSDLLLEDNTGVVDVREVVGPATGQTEIAYLGSQWTILGSGDFLGHGVSDFLIENTLGVVDIGEVTPAGVAYAQIANFGGQWSVVGSGDFQAHGADQFLIENAAGIVDLGEIQGPNVAYAQIASYGSIWNVVGTGNFQADGKTDFLVENTAGVLDLGEVQGPNVAYAQIANFGSQWKVVETGDFLNDGKDQFLIESTAGVVQIGEVQGSIIAYTTVAGIDGTQWTFVGAGDYLSDGHDQFLVESSAGMLDVGELAGGQLHLTQVGTLGPEWSLHG